MAFAIRKTDVQEDAEAFLGLFAANDEDAMHPTAVVAENEWELWLAETEDGQLAGGVLTRTQPDETGELRGFEENLLVDAAYRRQGLARELMQVAEAHHGGGALVGMQLAADADNAAAIGLYESLGYRLVKRYTRRRPDSDGNIVESARIRMWKDF